MSTKESHLVAFWVRACKRCAREAGVAPTAGQVAKYVGQSRTTAKKYLDQAVTAGVLEHTQWTHVNGAIATGYCWRVEGE